MTFARRSTGVRTTARLLREVRLNPWSTSAEIAAALNIEARWARICLDQLSDEGMLRSRNRARVASRPGPSPREYRRATEWGGL